MLGSGGRVASFCLQNFGTFLRMANGFKGCGHVTLTSACYTLWLDISMGRAPDGIVTNISRIGSTRIDSANYALQFSNGNTLGEDTTTAPEMGSHFSHRTNIMNENTARNNA